MTGDDPGLGIEGVLETLGSPGRAAAAGSAAALTGAIAAAVVGKATRAAGRTGAAAQAALLQQRLVRFAELDAAALGEARRLLAAGDAQDARRDFELGRALREAMSVPASIGATCADVALLAGDEREWVLQDDRPDLEAAAALAAGAAQASALLVAVNLTATPDDEHVAASRASATTAADVVAAFGTL